MTESYTTEAAVRNVLVEQLISEEDVEIRMRTLNEARSRTNLWQSRTRQQH